MLCHIFIETFVNGKQEREIMTFQIAAIMLQVRETQQLLLWNVTFLAVIISYCDVAECSRSKYVKDRVSMLLLTKEWVKTIFLLSGIWSSMINVEMYIHISAHTIQYPAILWNSFVVKYGTQVLYIFLEVQRFRLNIFWLSESVNIWW